MATRKPVVFNAGSLEVIQSGDTVDTASLPSTATERAIGITIDGAGSAITTGVKGYIVAAFSGTITGWDIVGSPEGSIVIDVWKSAASTMPTVANTIAGTEKPTLSAAQINSDVALSTWTTAVTKGQVFGFRVDSASLVTRVTLTLRLTV